MPIDEAGLSAALNAGIAEASGSPAPSAPAPDPTPPTGGDSNAPATDSPAEPVGDAGGSPSGATAPAPADGVDDEPAAGGDDPDGGDAPVGDGEGAEPTGEAPKPDAPEKPDEPAKEPDPINDPLPNALKKETKERFGKVIGMFKAAEEKVERLTRDLEVVMAPIERSQATPAQFSQAFQYLEMVNSGDPNKLRQALTFMQREMRSLATMIGEPVPGVNFLEGHDDLIQEVGSGRLTMQRATEIAIGREQRRVGEATLTAQSQAQQAQQAQQQAIGEGRQALNALEARLRTDPHYAAKRPALVKMLKPLFARIPPHEWAGEFERAYRTMPNPVAPAAPAARPAAPAGGAPANTPLRASQPAGSATPAPASPLEAMNLALASNK